MDTIKVRIVPCDEWSRTVPREEKQEEKISVRLEALFLTIFKMPQLSAGSQSGLSAPRHRVPV